MTVRYSPSVYMQTHALYLLILIVNVLVCHSKIVRTNNGPIVGQDRGNYETFFGIPYALVDEENPFGRSLPHPDFTTPFNATDSSVKCPQLVPTESGILQCLRLNIYVPKSTNKNIPVFVYIHGGGFIFGSAGEYDAKHLVQHEIVVVTINYRMGPYGFFCLNTDTVPGNQGLKDQVTALRWIKRNIAAFGGDPDKVTIAGESYGGGSVDLHLYSENEKLFDKAIIQSGGADAEALIVEPNNNAAYTLAKTFDPTVKIQDALSLLAKQDPIEVMKAFRSSGMLLRACEERKQPNKKIEYFFTANSKALHCPLKVSGTHIMIGYTSKETFADFFKLANEAYGRDFFLEKIKNNFRLDEKTTKEAVQSVKSFYLGNKNISKDVMLELIDFTSDFMVNYPAERSVNRFLEQGAMVYKYLFSYIGNSPYKNIEGVGAHHTEELQYLFDWQTAGELRGEDNILMRDRMTKMWANFVKFGNPTLNESDLITVRWQQTSQNTKPYLDIDLQMKMKEKVYQNRMEFWNTFWRKYGKSRMPYPSEPARV
uniref:Alphe-esterase EST36 n=1 Tax=Chilo suppressalis TaxID=168631 RepID=A0A6B7HES9_CHISP|nr:alphe-esterase EST36 [Chilo suppressalis]